MCRNYCLDVNLEYIRSIVELNICWNICIQRKGEEGESRKRKRIKRNEAIWRLIFWCVHVCTGSFTLFLVITMYVIFLILCMLMYMTACIV